jgi:uncharacterized membrane protein
MMDESSDKTGFERLVFFSDAVFAIAITLLVLELRVPDIAPDQAEHELLPGLLKLWPHLVGYLLSFLVIGLYWIRHHRLYRYIVRYDTGLLLLNVLLLLGIAFLPFPTAVLSTYQYTRVAVVFYTLSLLVCAVLLTLIWWYATWRNRLVDPKLDPRVIRYVSLLLVTLLLAYLPALGIAFVNPRLAVRLLLLVLVLSPLSSLVLDRRYYGPKTRGP